MGGIRQNHVLRTWFIYLRAKNLGVLCSKKTRIQRREETDVVDGLVNNYAEIYGVITEMTNQQPTDNAHNHLRMRSVLGFFPLSNHKDRALNSL